MSSGTEGRDELTKRPWAVDTFTWVHPYVLSLASFYLEEHFTLTTGSAFRGPGAQHTVQGWIKIFASLMFIHRGSSPLQSSSIRMHVLKFCPRGMGEWGHLEA